MTRRLGPLCLVLALVCSAAPVLAQDDPNTSRGFSADNLYQFNEIDTVDLFNGNLALVVPLGLKYPINAGFGYRLQLTYNSNVWDYEAKPPEIPGEDSEPLTAALPGRQFNAGLGWKLSLGELQAVSSGSNLTEYYVYVGPDGGSHRFRNQLHEGDDNAAPGYYYTRDNSYLRLHLTSQATVGTIEFPDGKVHRFSRPAGATDFKLDWIEDRHGNRLSVTYTDGDLTWNLSDGHRTHKIVFVVKDSDGEERKFVDRIELDAFGSATATYDFVYDDSFETERPTADTYHSGAALTAKTPVLSQVLLPDGSSWKVESYETTAEGGAGMLRRLRLPTGGQVEYTYGRYVYPVRVNPAKGLNVNVNVNHGVVSKRMLNLAGGCFQVGEVGCEWTYTPSDPADTDDHRTTTVVHPNGDKVVHHFDQSWDQEGTAQELWRYGLPIHPTRTSGSRRLSQEIYDGNTLVRQVWLEYERDVVLQTPNPSFWYDSNRRVKSRRTVYKDDQVGTVDAYRQEGHSDFDGLGHYRQTVQASNVPGGSARTLRAEYNDGNGSYTVSLGTNSASGGYASWPTERPWLISTYTQKSQGEGVITARQEFCFDTAEDFKGAAGVVLRERTLAGGSPGSDDVLVVYERDPANGNVIGESYYGGDTGTVGTGDVCDATLGTEQYRREREYAYGSMEESKWVEADESLALYTHRATIDASTGLPATVTATNGLTTSLNYDTSGRLSSQVAPTDHGTNTTYTYTPAQTSPAALAKVLIEQHDNGGSPLLTKNEIVFDDFGRPLWDRRWEPSGEWSTVVTATNAMGWKSSVSERQFGYPDQQTTYKRFDPFGRPTRIIPPDGPQHQIVLAYAGDRSMSRSYTVCAADDGCLNDGTGPTPGDLELRNDTLIGVDAYEVDGNVEIGPSYTVSASGDLTVTATGSIVLNDGFSVASGGRAVLGTDPDLVVGSPGETTVTHTEISDKHGRLYQVKEPSAPDGSHVTTTYSYDVGNRLAQAVTTNGSTTQTRKFTYDRRGFLTSEQHPEKGTSGNETVTYSSYDPLGNPGKKVDGPFDLRYGYDRAGRLITIQEWYDSALRPMKTFTYASTNDGSNLRAGKLEVARRWNYANLDGVDYTVRVDETYEYGSRAGTVSKRATQVHVNGTPQESFDQYFDWRHLGTLNYLDYPTCTHDFTICYTPNRRIGYSYNAANRSYLETVFESAGSPNNLEGALLPTYVEDHSYHANGQTATVLHNNGVMDHQSQDAGMARPARIWTTGATSNWSSGDYVYDGAGNISAIGDQRFSYDGVSRLTRAEIGTALTNGGSSLVRTYTYDAFGNLTTKGGLTLPVDSSTNRLTIATEYDSAGNVTDYHGILFEYDAFGMVTQRDDGNETWSFVYTADDERLWTYPSSLARSARWTIRDLDGQVLRDYRQSKNNHWSVERDYIRGNGRLLAAIGPNNTITHFHPDHLGTPRLITNGSGGKVAYHAYYPYGEEATYWNQDLERLKFTGHERDFYDETGAGDDLDYHHARYYSSVSGRYLGPDPAGIYKPLGSSSLWNRYSYAIGNPLAVVDPDGKEAVVIIVKPNDDNFFESYGHAALYVKRDGKQDGISAGGSYTLLGGRTSLSLFLSRYRNSGRTLTTYHLRTTPEQDAAMLKLLGPPYGDLVKPTAFTMTRENCAKAVCNVLEEGGLLGDAEDVLGFFDKPTDLQEALEEGKLAHLVEAIKVHEPGKLTRRRTVKEVQQRSDPFAGSGFCSADNVCH